MSFVRRLLPEPDQREASFLGDLFRREAVGGALALTAAVIGVAVGQLAWSEAYLDLRHLEVGPLDLEHWAADGALTLFFFVAGLELKRELVVGSLRRPADAAVPVVAAIVRGRRTRAALPRRQRGGRGSLEGWAVPAATDIAFALAVLAVVGSNLPTALRAFLLTLAVVDDLIVIVIIAVFFTDSLHLACARRRRSRRWRPGRCFNIGGSRTPLLYVPLAVLAWWMVHESGIHATIAGVALGLLTRVRHDPGEQVSPAEHLEHVWSPVSSGRRGAVLRADVGRSRDHRRRRPRARPDLRSGWSSAWSSASRSACCWAVGWSPSSRGRSWTRPSAGAT